VRFKRTKIRQGAIAIAAIAGTTALLASSPAALAQSGGAGFSGPAATGTASSKPRNARLVSGKAVPPSNAPARVRAAIKAGNHIRSTPYKWGGGHGSWADSGYDCSGAVSYLLHAAGMLNSPFDSGALTRWGKKGKGRWITVRANGGHTYIVVAGLRMDTSGGPGPRWYKGNVYTHTNGPFKTRRFSKQY
jgi:cell wall-associated NlpC family hydrolase